MVETPDKVEAFLEQVKDRLKNDSDWDINDEPWVGKVNKTLRYMTETGVKKKDIKLKIRKLEDDYLLVMSFHPEEPDGPEKKLQFPYKK